MGSFLKGIAASNYTKPIFLEIIPTTAKEMVRIPVPVVNFRPRLITIYQLDLARQNILHEPYLGWYQLIKENADRYINGSQAFLISPVIRQAEDIKNLAFIYWIEGDPRYLEAAEKLLKQLPEAPKIYNLEGGKGSVGWGDFLQSAQAVPAICVAVDLIYNDMDPDLQKEVRRKLLEVTTQLMDAVVYTPANNHVTVMAVAILVNSLFEEQPREFIAFSRQEMWITGLEAFSQGLGLAIPDGGYAEGVYYARFILDYISPLSVYFQNNTAEKLFEHPYLERMVSWVNANDKGSGRYSAFDDAFQTNFFFLPLIISQSRVKNNWYAHWASLPAENSARKNMAEAICVFEVLPDVLETTQPSVVFFAESGQAIFRDSPLQPQIFGSFISERPEWFAARHEHIDPMSFEISAFGEDIIIDAGYGDGTGSINREWYLSAQAHNGLFKNGLGTNLNPIWGDPIYSTFEHAYSTGRGASMSMKHYLGDVELNRQVYFLNQEYFIIFDAFKGSGEYSAGLNFNYLGRLNQTSPYQLNIQGKSSVLNIYTLNSQNLTPIITDNFGLYTPPGKSQPMRTVQLEHQATGDGFYFTLIHPENNPQSHHHVVMLPVSGNGRGLRIRDPDNNKETMLTLNRGSLIKTAQYTSDASVAVVETESANQVSSLLLINFTSFESSFISLYSDFPITLYLERNDFYWQGYIQTEDERMSYHLTVLGIEEYPFKFNRAFVKPVEMGIEKSVYTLTGSGSIDIGNGPAVQIPYRHHPAPDMLQWFSEQYDYQAQYEFWSDYHRNVLDNQIVMQLENGFSDAIDYWTDQYFPGTQLIKQGGYVSLGLLQSSYSSQSQTTYTPRIPHRYQYSQSSDQITFDFYEEGIFSTDFLRIQNLHINLRSNQGSGISYRGSNWFEQQQMHRLRIFANNGSQVFYQLSRLQDMENHNLQFSYLANRIALNPGYNWNNVNGDNDLFLNWRYSRYYGSLRQSQQTGENRSYQSLAGSGRRWSFSLEGSQIDGPLLSYQDYYGDLFLNITQSVLYAQGINLRYSDQWEVPFAYGEMNWLSRSRGISGRLQKRQARWDQRMAVFWNLNAQRFSGDLSLKDFNFEKGNLLRLKWRYQSRKIIQVYTQLKYGYRPVLDNYGLEVYHTFWLPGKNGWYFQPILGESIPSTYFFQWIGGGITYSGAHSFFSQVLVNYLLRPIQIDYQTSLNIYGKKARLLYLIWFQVKQLGRQLYSMEIRVQRGANRVQPGIFYSYLRDGGIRFEGYLEWRW
jgi:hypothetical protein